MWELQLYLERVLVRVLFRGNYPDAVVKFFDFAKVLGYENFEPERDVDIHPFRFYWIDQYNYLYLTKITPKDKKENPDPADFVELDDN